MGCSGTRTTDGVRPATSDDVELSSRGTPTRRSSRYWDDETFTPAELAERLARADVDSWIVEERASRSASCSRGGSPTRRDAAASTGSSSRRRAAAG